MKATNVGPRVLLQLATGAVAALAAVLTLAAPQHVHAAAGIGAPLPAGLPPGMPTPPDHAVVDVAVGNHAICAVVRAPSTGPTRIVKCWGQASSGALGIGPWDYQGAVDGGSYLGDDPGELGNNMLTVMETTSALTKLAASLDTFALLTDNNQIFVWGISAALIASFPRARVDSAPPGFGQLTLYTPTLLNTSTITAAGEKVVSISLTVATAVALTDKGNVWTWGNTLFPQGFPGSLGDGIDTDVTSGHYVDLPQRVAGSVVEACATFAGFVLRTTNGSVYATGSSVDVELGPFGFVAGAPSRISWSKTTPNNASLVRCSMYDMCVVDVADQAIWCRGRHSGTDGFVTGQGPSSTAVFMLNYKPGPRTTVQDIVLGNSHTCATLSNGTFVCWGLGEAFLPHDADVFSYYFSAHLPFFAPTLMAWSGTDISRLVAGGTLTFAIRASDKKLFGMGFNGNNFQASRLGVDAKTPVPGWLYIPLLGAVSSTPQFTSKPTTFSPTAARPTSAPTHAAGDTFFTYLGCFADNPATPSMSTVLLNETFTGPDTSFPRRCIQAVVKAGFSVMGMQVPAVAGNPLSFQVCFASNSLSVATARGPATRDMPACQRIGFDFDNVRIPGGYHATTVDFRSVTSVFRVGPSSSLTAVRRSMMGCVSNPDVVTWDAVVDVAGKATPELCAQRAPKGAAAFGLAGNQTCFYAKSVATLASLPRLDSIEGSNIGDACSLPCSADATATCGSATGKVWNLYALNSNTNYLGCFEFRNLNTFLHGLGFAPRLNPRWCNHWALFQKSAFFGLLTSDCVVVPVGRQDPNSLTTFGMSDRCSNACVGDETKVCGAVDSKAVSLYSTIGAETGSPSSPPSLSPTTGKPSKSPTFKPSSAPTTSNPSKAPTTTKPSKSPTRKPSLAPTTSKPSKSPTRKPSLAPVTSKPSQTPTTSKPSKSPMTTKPSKSPTRKPSLAPVTSKPSQTPTSSKPSKSPTTSKPSKSPTFKPSLAPATSKPSQTPTTSKPSKSPTTTKPSKSPTTARPSKSPTPKPTPPTKPPTLAPGAGR